MRWCAAARSGGPCRASQEWTCSGRWARTSVSAHRCRAESQDRRRLRRRNRGCCPLRVLVGASRDGTTEVFLDRLGRLDSGSFHVINGFQICGLSLAPVLRRLLDGEGFWPLAQGWLSQEDPTRCAWPAGPGVSAAVRVQPTSWFGRRCLVPTEKHPLGLLRR